MKTVTQRSQVNGLIVQTPAEAIPSPNCGSIACADPTWAVIPTLAGTAPDGVEGTPYAWEPTITGGTGPYTYSGTVDAPGLEIDPELGIVGTPTEALGPYAYSLVVTDSLGNESAPLEGDIAITPA